MLAVARERRDQLYGLSDLDPCIDSGRAVIGYVSLAA
jgi:hypothetical protein